MSEHRLRELLLVRHAKSDWKEDLDDKERPISEKGKKAASRLGHWLQENNLMPSYALVSPAQRAQQTFKRLKVDKDICPQITLDQLYLATLDELIEVLAEIPKHYERVMIIGHNPGLEELAQFLEYESHCEDCETRLFPTGSLAHFILPNSWKNLNAGAGKLVQFIRPKDVKPSHHKHHHKPQEEKENLV
ncbi:SixA phosphatase family protein [Hydrogenovibrio kuenenii]|uniref:SixA phosphatase family protein n=1 Tax=Hydrogenovibrio kuenenii TaxID=63658 RepID=UPI0004AC9311|nr:histidine phosphatase family protein [Hydrogenovibrio kuenenii]